MLGIVEALKGQANLFEIVDALVSVGRLTNLLNCGKQDPNQNGNDGDHHQKLN